MSKIFIPENTTDTQWKQFKQHWISTNGEVKNMFGKTKLMNEGKYYINKDTKISAGRLLAEVFQIEGYEKLNDSKFCVTRIDNNLNYSVNNIKIVPKSHILNDVKSGIYEKQTQATKTASRTRSVFQFTSDDKINPIREFESVAQASRESGEPEQRIRDVCNNKKCLCAKFHWEWKNKEQSEEYSKKYSSNK